MMIEKRRGMECFLIGASVTDSITPPVQPARPAGSSVRLIYSFFLYLLIPFAVQRLIYRGIRNRGYWRRWQERFGWVPRLSGPVIWVHAVSVGEVRAAEPLVQALRRMYPDHRILVTTMTPTGSDTVRDRFGQHVSHCYLPYDLPTAIFRFLNRVGPRLAIMMETEIWPNIFHQCASRQIPVVLANVRMSEQSAAGYRRFRALTRSTLACVAAVGAQTRDDAARATGLGARNVQLTGSIKFELIVAADLLASAATWRSATGARPVWIAASTRDNEEQLVLGAFRDLREQFPDLLLILVPRHPERFDSVAKMCTDSGFRIERRSISRAPVAAGTDVLVGDTMGELVFLYAASDVSFVGGSLRPLGGQNPLESLAVGTPVVFGPSMFNFSEISRMSLERGAACEVRDAKELARAVGRWLSDSVAREVAGRAGQRMIAENRGALQNTLALITGVFKG